MVLKNKTILLTGGAGFIGSHLTEALAGDNRVTVYDNFTSSVMTPAELTKIKGVNVVAGDVLDGNKLEKAMRGSDVVFHLAVACVRLSLSREVYVHEVNATGTLSALLAAKKAKVKRFVYISSSEIYGSTVKPLISESHPVRPATVYGMSKYVGELYTKHYFGIEGLPALIVRPFNAYGPREHFDGVYGEVIPRFAVRALNGKQPTIFGDGRQTRDFTYVTDTVAGIMRAASNDALLGDVVNIAYGREVSIREIARLISREAHLPFHPAALPPRPNDVIRLAADISKARRLLTFSPSVSVADGLKKYMAWLTAAYPDRKKLLSRIPETNW